MLSCTRRLLVPAVVDALQEIIEEALLQVEAVAAVEERPVRIAVDLEPFLFRRRLGEAVEVAPRMDALAAPVGAGQERERHLGEIGRARAVPLVVERVLLQVLEDVDAVLGQLLVGERDRPRYRFAGVRVLLGPLPAPVLDVDHLVLGPALLELAQDAAVVAGVAVPVVLPLPRDDGGQMRRVLPGHAPLVARVIGDPEHPDFAVAPGLRARPLDALVEVFDLPRGVAVHEARGPAGAAGIHAHHRVPVRDPPLGIGDLPVLVLVGRALEDFRMIGDHLLPLHRVAILEGKTLRVDPVRQDHRVAPIFDGPVDVRAEDEAVVHLDGRVPHDAHAVPYFAPHFDFRRLVHLGSPSCVFLSRLEAL